MVFKSQKTKPLTPLQIVHRDVKAARTRRAMKSKIKLDWDPTTLAGDMLIVAEDLVKRLKKYKRKPMHATAAAIRKDTKAIETLGLAFRVQSIKKKTT